MKNDGHGYIYVVQLQNADAYFKVGYAFNWRLKVNDQRFQAKPTGIQVIALYEGTYWLARELREKLAAHRVGGGWYRPSGLKIAFDFLAQEPSYPVNMNAKKGERADMWKPHELPAPAGGEPLTPGEPKRC